MFSRKEDKATRVGGQLAEAYVQSVARDRKLPAGFWDDPFVLGFLGACAAKGLSATDLVGTDPSDRSRFVRSVALLRVVTRVLSELSGVEGPEMRRRIKAAAGSADFRRGADNADTCLGLTGNAPGCHDLPEVAAVQARLRAARNDGRPADPDETGHKALVTAVNMSLFIDVIMERFDPPGAASSN